jgi:hypothetical protein
VRGRWSSEYLLVDGASEAKHEYLATLRHVVLAAHGAVRVDVFTRDPDGWSARSDGTLRELKGERAATRPSAERSEAKRTSPE